LATWTTVPSGRDAVADPMACPQRALAVRQTVSQGAGPCRTVHSPTWANTDRPRSPPCPIRFEGLVPARAWGFKSPLRHHRLGTFPESHSPMRQPTRRWLPSASSRRCTRLRPTRHLGRVLRLTYDTQLRTALRSGRSPPAPIRRSPSPPATGRASSRAPRPGARRGGPRRDSCQGAVPFICNLAPITRPLWPLCGPLSDRLVR
jgi:hypothetical protein